MLLVEVGVWPTVAEADRLLPSFPAEIVALCCCCDDSIRAMVLRRK